jgi:hypothetical protein
VTDAETYLRELRRSLPVRCRRRFVAEVREHFASAIAAEAEHGVGRLEAEQLTIERLGPAQALADQLLADLRSGALGRRARLVATLTTARLAAAATVVVVAVAVAASAVAVGRHSPQASPAPKPARRLQLIVDARSGELRPLLVTFRAGARRHAGQGSTTWSVRPVTYSTPTR